MAGSSSDSVFLWGNKVPEFELSYESMRFKGVWYNLHDCVSCKSGLKLPFVGKIMRLFEDEAGARKVRLRWFFRPYELPAKVIKGLSEGIESSNELFIGVGNVKGVENENVVEVIQGKVMVLCTAKFGGNILPLSAHINAAKYVFNRAYDASARKVIKMMYITNKTLLQKLINKAEWLPMEVNKEDEESEAIPTKDDQSSSINMDVGTRTIKRCPERRMSVKCISQPEKKLKEKE